MSFHYGIGIRHGNKPTSHSLTALNRWSCDEKSLPDIEQIKALHVYDFDNTLFASPLPNKQLWNGQTIGQLQGIDVFVNGGWWHDVSILAATGDGVETEEARGWNGWWNEQIVSLVKLSMQQADALTILLTGRKEGTFGELVKRIVRSKKLAFDMICLKQTVGPNNQKYPSTMAYKQDLLRDLLYTYRNAEEIRIYEDRPKHVKAFQDFFFEFNRELLGPNPSTPRKPFLAEVIAVSEKATLLDPVTEVAEVQRMINSNNAALRDGSAPRGARAYQIKRNVFLTGYLIDHKTSERLKKLAKIPPNISEDDIRYLASNILIAPRPADRNTLDRAGGMGRKMRWRVTGISYHDNKVWAARVEPVPQSAPYYSEDPIPLVVLALRRGARPIDAKNVKIWLPVSGDDAFEFDTVVGEKALLRVEVERPEFGDPHSNHHNNRSEKGPTQQDEDFPPIHAQHSRHRQPQQNWQQRNPDDRRPTGVSANYRGGNHNRGRSGHRGSQHGINKGGRAAHGRVPGGNARGRTRHIYRSLDDMSDHRGLRGGPHSNYEDASFNY